MKNIDFNKKKKMIYVLKILIFMKNRDFSEIT